MPDPAVIDNMADMSDEQYQNGLSIFAQKALLWRYYGVTYDVERTVLHIVNSGYELCDSDSSNRKTFADRNRYDAGTDLPGNGIYI